MTHIVWDWNGTLFHDIEAVVQATNRLFQPYGIGPYDIEGFREVYTRPIWVAYERMLGRPLREGEWEMLDRGFHEHYHSLMEACQLTEGALASLQAWQESGRTQSLLSMWRHERLVGKVSELGIDGHFVRVDGSRTSSGGHKAEHMVEHLRALGIDPEKVVVIGDSVDDAHAAQHVGARAILYAGGMTKRSELERVGVPVVDRLADALDLI
ncbi:phosphatase [Thermobispora bispora]|jgi:phosphoglycolate phosphatase-like HAD superfamily hydrolase|uniref:HAD-superfamily hydrolase, subfamily IA, variant 1 n=1 Tax=Thermobispora bispora (strain ATCC 19993 / DSM 43833 / CBS 139.67 / JCM 10125 / KCTC 9307 / NBRC 14880 / R51) TaxID=469371 RepID=D6Y6D8_THEBD|nr:HAD family hydrolase [Thermobispora bispora]MBO2472850.1 HAD family hydrolase [Actinomycetales bacterium]MDI9581462.1 HAD family hydrolase [Thermobispora sp.]ADG87510.1 HAD-superfamily hydrolase, subfamily IA, variant 1 [Thermobispora bispora DSM 43833]MBX6166886.1 HAD family hydrolase [Thermobispora bispora]QSI47443.1 HAD family hydrolase [Thermobispora bispora]